MVKLSFQDAGRLSLMFNTPDSEENSNMQNNIKSRVIQAKEVKVIRNNKPVMHVRQFYDSANPEKNKNVKFIKTNKQEEEEEQ